MKTKYFAETFEKVPSGMNSFTAVKPIGVAFSVRARDDEEIVGLIFLDVSNNQEIKISMPFAAFEEYMRIIIAQQNKRTQKNSFK